MSHRPTILFAGGGTGGHIFPSLAIQERLAESAGSALGHFLVSERPLDRQLIVKHQQAFTALPVCPLPSPPWSLRRWWRFVPAWRASVKQVTHAVRQLHPAAVVAMGGFVSGPAVVVARRLGVPVVMVNLDAVAGKANRRLAKRSDFIFTVYRDAVAGTPIGFPLRRSALGPADPKLARRELQLAPDRDTLLVVGGSQGASSINQMMVQLVGRPGFRDVWRSWQVLHLTGDRGTQQIDRVYADLGIPVRVMRFCDQMGLAWSAATVALSRAGAGSVAEAWANATPTIFLPYPYHRDQHQKRNATDLVNAGGACLLDDRVDAVRNADQLTPVMLDLIHDPMCRQQMIRIMQQTWLGNGADAVSQHLLKLIGLTSRPTPVLG